MIVVLSIIIIILLLYLIYSRRKIYKDIDEYAETIINKDFSRKYPEKNRKNKRLYKQFNTITQAFLNLAGEKEAQQHYLKEMLELVDTGILAYDIETHKTLWMNDAFATMLNIPHIKNINWLKKRNEGLFNELLNIPINKSTLITIHAQKQTIKTMTNASYAINGKKQAQIHLFSGSDSEGHPYITVADNGNGIPDHIRDKIFIPFFSTKKKWQWYRIEYFT